MKYELRWWWIKEWCACRWQQMDYTNGNEM